MRFGGTAKVLAECKLKYYRISECRGQHARNGSRQEEPSRCILYLLLPDIPGSTLSDALGSYVVSVSHVLLSPPAPTKLIMTCKRSLLSSSLIWLPPPACLPCALGH